MINQPSGLRVVRTRCETPVHLNAERVLRINVNSHWPILLNIDYIQPNVDMTAFIRTFEVYIDEV